MDFGVEVLLENVNNSIAGKIAAMIYNKSEKVRNRYSFTELQELMVLVVEAIEEEGNTLGIFDEFGFDEGVHNE